MRRVLLAALILGTAISLAVFAPARILDRMIFQPTKGVAMTPDGLGIEASELYLTAEDGVALHAFWLPTKSPSLGLSLLFLHGNAGNASHRLPMAAELTRLGVDVLLLDYRGYGRSEGRPSEAGVARDARAGLDFLQDEARRGPEEIVVMGHSLGGAVAVELAAGRPLAGLILQSTFTSVADISRATIGFGMGTLLVDIFPSDRRIARIQAPLLSIHGDRDTIVPFELGQQLFRGAPEPKSFHRVRGAGHNDVAMVGGAAYFETLRAFLHGIAGRSEPAKPESRDGS